MRERVLKGVQSCCWPAKKLAPQKCTRGARPAAHAKGGRACARVGSVMSASGDRARTRGVGGATPGAASSPLGLLRRAVLLLSAASLLLLLDARVHAVHAVRAAPGRAGWPSMSSGRSKADEDRSSNERLVAALFAEQAEKLVAEKSKSVSSHLQLEVDDDGSPKQLRFAWGA